MTLSPNWCVLCKKEEKQANHLFIHCPFASWNYLIYNSDVSWIMPKDMVDLFSSWIILGLGERAKIFWGSIIHAIVWGIGRKEIGESLNGKKIPEMKSLIASFARWVAGFLLIRLSKVWLSSFETLALLGKWLWIFSMEESSLWHSTILSIVVIPMGGI